MRKLRESMKSRLSTILLIAISAPCANCSGLVLYDNGTIVNHPPNVSATYPPDSFFYGWNASALDDYRVADDFVAGHNWSVSQFSFVMYERLAPGFTFTYANLDLLKGDDINSATGIWSVRYWSVTNEGFVAYRTRYNTLGNTERPCYRVGADTPLIKLESGERYWIAWSMGGMHWTGGPFVPHIMDGQKTVPGNSVRSHLGSAYYPYGRPAGYELSFQVRGVPEPTTVLALGAGIIALAARRRRRYPKRPEM